LLLAGAVTNEGISIELETELKSAPYVDITLEVLDDFGVEARKTDAGFAVDGGQSYARPRRAASTRSPATSRRSRIRWQRVRSPAPRASRIEGAHPSAQGDTAIVDIVDRMGADVDWNRDAGTIDVAEAPLSGIEVEVENTPDLLPTIATLGAVAEGDTHIANAEHVRYKETDRVSAMAEELGKMGVENDRGTGLADGPRRRLEPLGSDRLRTRRPPDHHGARARGTGRRRRPPSKGPTTSTSRSRGSSGCSRS